MYLNPQIHDTQDTCTIHVRYKGIHSRIRISSPTCGGAWIPPNPRDTCPACIPHVSRMYPACLNSYQMHLSLDAFEIHVSHHVSWMYPACILITLADTCISHVSRMYLASQIRTSSWRIQDTCIVILYLGVSWCIIRCIVMKSPRYTYPDVSWYVSSVTPRKRPRYMYLDVSDMYPKMYLGLVWDTCKIHAKYQDTCILLECNRAFKIHLRYIRIHEGYMYPSGYTQDTSRYIRIRILITNPPKLDNKPPRSRATKDVKHHAKSISRIYWWSEPSTARSY
jgi:hypothetical protein